MKITCQVLLVGLLTLQASSAPSQNKYYLRKRGIHQKRANLTKSKPPHSVQFDWSKLLPLFQSGGSGPPILPQDSPTFYYFPDLGRDGAFDEDDWGGDESNPTSRVENTGNAEKDSNQKLKHFRGSKKTRQQASNERSNLHPAKRNKLQTKQLNTSEIDMTHLANMLPKLPPDSQKVFLESFLKIMGDKSKMKPELNVARIFSAAANIPELSTHNNNSAFKPPTVPSDDRNQLTTQKKHPDQEVKFNVLLENLNKKLKAHSNAAGFKIPQATFDNIPSANSKKSANKKKTSRQRKCKDADDNESVLNLTQIFNVHPKLLVVNSNLPGKRPKKRKKGRNVQRNKMDRKPFPRKMFSTEDPLDPASDDDDY